MASITKRPDGKWRARYRDQAGKEHSRHFPRKVDGQRWLDEVTASVVTGQYVDPKAGRVTFRDYAEQWRAGQVYRPSTAELVERALRLRVYPVIGDRPLASIKPDVVQQLVARLSSTLAPATVTVTYSYVATVFKSAVRSGLVAKTPCDGIKLPRVVKTRVVPLSTDEVLSIADAMPDHLRAMVVLAAGTGMRQGELFGLTLDRVDFLRRTITVDRQLLHTGADGYHFGPPKTETSNRVIPLPDSIGRELSAHIAQHPQGDDGLLFVGGRGAALRRGTFCYVWGRATKQAGLDGVVFHQLRHHYASLLIRHGESVKTVQARLGHKSAEETLNTYAHLWPDSDDRTRQAVDAAFSGDLADSLRTEAILN